MLFSFVRVNRVTFRTFSQTVQAIPTKTNNKSAYLNRRKSKLRNRQWIAVAVTDVVVNKTFCVLSYPLEFNCLQNVWWQSMLCINPDKSKQHLFKTRFTEKSPPNLIRRTFWLRCCIMTNLFFDVWTGSPVYPFVKRESLVSPWRFVFLIYHNRTDSWPQEKCLQPFWWSNKKAAKALQRL